MMNTIDFSLLETYLRVSTASSEQAVYSVPAADLLRPEKMEQLLSLSGRLLKATSKELPASFVGIAFFHVCAAKFVLMSQQGVALDLSLHNLVFQVENGAKFPLSSFRIVEAGFKEVPLEERERFIRQQLTAFFNETINPVIAAIAECAGIKTDLIWNQYGGRLKYLHNYVMDNETREEIRERVSRDCELLKSLDPSVFGRRKNPFVHKPQYLESLQDASKQVMMKSSCCHYDKREGAAKCYTCPRATPEERVEIRERLLAAAAAK